MTFLFRRLLLGTFVYGSLFCVADSAYSQAMPANCLATNLDINLLTELTPSTESNQHLLAIEIRNRERQPCSLVDIVFKLPPDETERGLGGGTRLLPPGETVHLQLAWSSASAPVTGITMNDCAEHDTLRAFWAWPRSTKPFLEIRSARMDVCDQIWGSFYREGSYEPGEAIDKEWLDRFGLKLSDFPPLVTTKALETSSASHPRATLGTLSEVEYLAGTFESGYSGYFELFLRSSSPAFANCLFHSLRKREADGETAIYLNHCGAHRAEPEDQPKTKETRIAIRALCLLPERPGRVEYDIVTPIRENGEPALAYARTELSIRDPNQPMLPAIDTSNSRCRVSQLKLTTPPVELGTHWSRPRNFAEAGEEWFDGKVFELTNVSAETCLVGGVPELKYLNPPEITRGFLLSAVCRNCANPLFKPRDSRWIDLPPNQSAHFIVVRNVLDSDFQHLCTVLGGLELSMPGGGPTVRLPFEAGICGRLRVSVWREGRYDNDPLNIEYDRRAIQLQQQAVAPSPPKLCAAAASEDTGRAVIFRSDGPLTWALSTQPALYGDAVPVLLWLSNPTDKPIPVMTCQDIDFFWSSGVALFDSAGHRVLTHREEKEKLRDAGQQNVPVCIFSCTRNFPIDIAPHSCAHTNFSQRAYDFSRDLEAYYSIPPGHYVLVPAKPGNGCEVVANPPTANTGLSIVVLQP
jgi:hypothetical protein